jgi:cell wall assembly regulator SMI1
MLPRITEGNPSITPAAIEAFERERGITLPASYKEFLLATNGGVPELSAFPIRGNPSEPIGIVRSFLGIGVRVPTSELSYAYDLYAGGFPEGIVPIAGNGLGDYICLDLRDGKERVAFWDKRHFWGTGEWRESDLYHVADSFAEFLASLRPNSG